MDENETPEHPFMSNQTPARLLPKTVEAEDEEIHVQVSSPGYDPQVNGHQLVLSATEGDAQESGGRKLKVRETWDSKVDFLLSVIGFAVDLGNVWRFPYVCFSNGGGAFLIPYLIMYIFGGLPLFYMELALGQYQRAGCISVWSRICPMFKGIGFGICLIGLYVSWYYNTIIAWAVYYLYKSFRYEVPWSTCNNTWNSINCQTVTQMMSNNSRDDTDNFTRSSTEEFFYKEVLKIQLSDGMDNVGTINWPIALCLFIVFFVVYFSLWKGVKTSGKAVWITATVPYIVLITLLFRGIFLEGSLIGIKYYLKPNFTALATPDVWTAAASQIFFSLGPGFGVLLALSSYNKFHNNCYKDALVTSAVNCMTSFLAGFVVFSVLGYMSKRMGKDIKDIADQGPGLVFIAYPQAIATLKFAPFWAVIFFTMLITLGLDSTFGGLEAVITAILDEWPSLRRRRELFVLFLVCCCFLGALPTTTYGGFYILNWLDQHAAAIPLLFIVSCEGAALCWFYGIKRFKEDIRRMVGFEPGIYWRVCWTYISPIFIFAVFIANCATYTPMSLSVLGQPFDFPAWSLALAWCIVGSSIIMIPSFAIYTFLKTKGHFRERIYRMITPTKVPAHVEALQMSTIETGPYAMPDTKAFDSV